MDRLASLIAHQLTDENIRQIEFIIVLGIGLYGGYKVLSVSLLKPRNPIIGEDEDVLIVGAINILVSIISLSVMM